MTWPHRFAPLARRLRDSVLAALIATTVVGVSGAVPPSHVATAATPPTMHTLRIWYGSDDPTEQAWVEGIVQRFGAQHRDITVQFSFYSLDDMNDKTQLALAGGTPPDLIYSTPRGPGLPSYVRTGRLRDLTADARARGWAGQLRCGLLASYNQTLAANGPAAAAGKTYAVPYLLAADGVLYNMVQDGYGGWAIPTAAHDPAAALTFIDTMLSTQTAQTLLAHGLLPARHTDTPAAAPFQRDALSALASATPGVYVDAAPIPNFLATMEAQLQQVFAGQESPATLTRALQAAYSSQGRGSQYGDTDGEF